MKIHCLVVFLLVFLFSKALVAQQKEFGWLVGKWKLENKNEFEVWTMSHPGSELHGTAFQVHGADTVISEVISITYRGGSFHYIPDVAGDQSAVDFRITGFDEGSFIAENQKHDFPKLIRYKLSQTSEGQFINATIEGNGQIIRYRLKKVN